MAGGSSGGMMEMRDRKNSTVSLGYKQRACNP